MRLKHEEIEARTANRLFTADKNIINRKIGTVKPEVFKKVTDKLFEIIIH